jgi:hypothetical protein
MNGRFAAGVLLALSLWAPSAAAIVNGTADTTDSAVVALLASDGQGDFSVCSGTVVGVANGLASVLTAAHCCSSLVPAIVVTGNDYSAGEAYLANPSSSLPPAYPVIASSVKVDPKWDSRAETASDDFCMLRFAAPATLAPLPIALGVDNLTPGVSLKYVGFGSTGVNPPNSKRFSVSTPLSSLDANTLFSTGSQATCTGDEGGAVLAGSPPTLVGVIAFGDPTCSQSSVNARLISETGTGGFILSYLASSAGALPVPASPAWALAFLAAALVAAGVRAKHRPVSASCE